MLDNHRADGIAAGLDSNRADDSLPAVDSADLGLIMLLLLFALLLLNVIRF
jgi:hypothetical protein